MSGQDYISGVVDGIEFLIAFASIIGLLGLLLGLLMVIGGYKEAGIKDPRKEIDFGIVHDCFTITELINYQDMKLCKAGEGASLIKEGVTAIDGDFPINPDGGLKCFGHPIGATGCRMVVELTRQVLGKAEGLQVKDAETGFAHNLGGPFSVGAVTIVGRP